MHDSTKAFLPILFFWINVSYFKALADLRVREALAVSADLTTLSVVLKIFGARHDAPCATCSDTSESPSLKRASFRCPSLDRQVLGRLTLALQYMHRWQVDRARLDLVRSLILGQSLRPQYGG